MDSLSLKNITPFQEQFQVNDDSPAYMLLTVGVPGKRNKNWVQVLLNYNGVGDPRVPGSFITVVPDITGFPVNEVAEILDISRSTYYRVKEEPKLDPETADKISSLLKIFYQGVEAFEGDKQAFTDWMHIGIPSLGGQKPLELLKTESGRKSVSEAIARIEHNVYG